VRTPWLSRFWRYDRVLALELGTGCASLLDVGCGSNSPVRRLTAAIPRRTGVDAFAPALEASLAAGIHTDVRQMDILTIGEQFAPRSYDCVLASDVIEHLEKPDGLRLIAAMERIAARKVVIFTPNGFLPQAPYENNPWQAHRSGWDPDEMRALGYEPRGVNGWKGFFGERGRLTWRPRTVWKFVAIASRGWTATRPHLAFQLLCVKTLPPATRASTEAATADTA
jgi:SAM-dependent methyltransferase